MPSFTSIVSILAVAAASVSAYDIPAEYQKYATYAEEYPTPSKSVAEYIPSSSVKAAYQVATSSYAKAPEATYLPTTMAKLPIMTSSTSTMAPVATVVPSQGNCNVNAAVSCCDTAGATTGNNILGGSCALNLPLLGTNCDTGSAYCCETDQVGLINTNLACSPISAL